MIVVSNAHATPVSDRVAQRALEMRESLKLTRDAVAQAMAAAGATGMTVASLRSFEIRRRREIGVDELVALAAALGITPAELLDDVDGFTTPRPAMPADDLAMEIEAWLPGVRRAVREDIDQFGDLIGVEPSLAQLAYVLAEAIDNAATEPRSLPSLTKELRQVLDAIKNGRPGEGGDDDDLDDLASPD